MKNQYDWESQRRKDENIYIRLNVVDSFILYEKLECWEMIIVLIDFEPQLVASSLVSDYCSYLVSIYRKEHRLIIDSPDEAVSLIENWFSPDSSSMLPKSNSPLRYCLRNVLAVE